MQIETAMRKSRPLVSLTTGGRLGKAALTKTPWKLVWADEFDVPGLPDETKWSYETGFVRNRELQLYTSKRLENVRVEDSLLIIEARREEHPNDSYKLGSTDWRYETETAHYTSASLTTAGKASWTYGRIEAKAKIPGGGGIWPAIWTLADSVRLECDQFINWPRCGEIDIMEFVGSDPTVIHGTLHYAADGIHASDGAKHRPDVLPNDDFHFYAVEWDADRIDFFYDNYKFHSVELTPLDEPGGFNGFRHPHYLIVNLALGGAWAGPVDDAVLPQKLLVDYIRVYQRED